MRYKLSFILLALVLTSCSNVGQIDSGTVSEQQIKEQLNESDNSSESKEKPTSFRANDTEENRGQAEQSDLQRQVDIKHSYESPSEVSASHFANMDYLFLVQEEVAHFDDGGMPWYEYALLGSSNDTYEKGLNCYNEVNLLYEKHQVDSDYAELKERFGEGFINQYYRRHITAFSPDGERVLLKTYIDPPYNDEVFYEIYEKNRYWHSYIYRDIIFTDRINYTKGLQFASLNPVLSYGNMHTFYGTNILANYDSLNESKGYDISIITDSNDTLFYKEVVNSQGNKCIGIYSISDNQLIFQSEAIEDYPVTVDILDDKLIAGFTGEFHSDYLNYIEIDMKSNEVNYLFTYKKGSFSPDGRYFACPTRTKEKRGYNIYSLALGEMTFIESYATETESLNYLGNNNVYCWVSKNKIEELRELTKQ